MSWTEAERLKFSARAGRHHDRFVQSTPSGRLTSGASSRQPNPFSSHSCGHTFPCPRAFARQAPRPKRKPSRRPCAEDSRIRLLITDPGEPVVLEGRREPSRSPHISRVRHRHVAHFTAGNSERGRVLRTCDQRHTPTCVLPVGKGEDSTASAQATRLRTWAAHSSISLLRRTLPTAPTQRTTRVASLRCIPRGHISTLARDPVPLDRRCHRATYPRPGPLN